MQEIWPSLHVLPELQSIASKHKSQAFFVYPCLVTSLSKAKQSKRVLLAHSFLHAYILVSCDQTLFTQLLSIEDYKHRMALIIFNRYKRLCKEGLVTQDYVRIK